ncbi:MAG TPA: GntR family transcriptional regulator [Candidatus Dormibacteraeota bacterium]|jgi:DNA-binding GntR family transcriptional regulator|nr:GntR family transcriptional regulator [Candidatus Dormibacteraeota bacterium]
MSIDVLPQVPPDSRRDYLVRSLRDAIVRGDLKPGDRLVERDISERTGVSRGPVREALRQLEQEGLIVSIPYRGTRVMGVTQEEVEGILVPVRLVLERFAFARVLPDLKEADFEELEGIIAEIRSAVDAADVEAMVDADLRFHQRIVERAGHQCLQVWQSIVPRVRAYFYRDGFRHASLEHLTEEHHELLDAMRSGELDRVLPLLDGHIHETATLGGAKKPARSRKSRA